MPNIELKLIEYKDKEVLRNLMEYYLYDFSEFEHFDLYPHGRFEYKYLDHYWTDQDRFPYFILVDGLYAGFILVNQYGVLTENSLSMAEFFVMRKYRRSGIGESAVRQILDRHRGDWEVKVMNSNTTAQAFWRKVINRCTEGNCKEIFLDDERWHGYIHSFNNDVKA